MDVSLEKIEENVYYAVAGSFGDKSKYAYKILLKLGSQGKNAVAVNPKGGFVEEKECYKTISDIPGKIEMVYLVTPPAVTEQIVKECIKKGIKNIWMQPGAENGAAINLCKQNDINLVYNACMLLT